MSDANENLLVKQHTPAFHPDAHSLPARTPRNHPCPVPTLLVLQLSSIGPIPLPVPTAASTVRSGMGKRAMHHAYTQQEYPYDTAQK